MLCWESPGFEVRVNMWRLNKRLTDFHRAPGFGVAFFNETQGRYAAHYMGHDVVDDFVTAIQCQQGNSGPNYKPRRQWGDKFLEVHQGLRDQPEPGAVVLPCHDWKLEAAPVLDYTPEVQGLRKVKFIQLVYPE